MSEESVVPNIKDELDRKAIDAIEYLILKRRSGEISNEAYSVGLDTLFMTVSGIVSEDFIHIITEAGNEVKKPVKTPMERILEKAEAITW